jgi:3-carboxy-cis,cis-muconate cycloisomerase
MGFWATEWIALPQAMILAGGLLDKLAAVLEGLEVDEGRMRANLELTGGQIMAEAVMMALARTIGHEPAHQLVLGASRRALAEERTLASVLAEDPAIAARLSAADLEALLEPAGYLGLSASAAAAVEARVTGRDG